MTGGMANSPERKRRGCFFYGCLTVVIVLLVVVAATYFGVRYATSNLIETYTEASPVELPEVTISDSEWETLNSRVTEFREGLETNTEPVELSLSSDEINALIQRSEDFEDLKDKIYVDLQGDQIEAQVSVPLDKLSEVPMLGGAKGRYLNGTARLSAELRNNLLEVHLVDLTVGEKKLPEEAKNAIQRENLAKEMYRNPEGLKLIQKLDSLVVTNNLLILRLKPGVAAAAAEPVSEPVEVEVENAVPAENP